MIKRREMSRERWDGWKFLKDDVFVKFETKKKAGTVRELWLLDSAEPHSAKVDDIQVQ